MSEMIERVARAIYEAMPGKKVEGAFDEQDLAVQLVFKRVGRAAIEAMRQPTETMLDAAYEWHEKITATETHPHARGTWRSMIDAAVSEEERNG